jgi:predicted small lipoprotein YifL
MPVVRNLFVFAACACALLAACGQKGPLTMPPPPPGAAKPPANPLDSLAPSTAVSSPLSGASSPTTGTASPVRNP